MSLSRVWAAVARRLFDIPHALAWHSVNPSYRENHERLEDLVGIHANQRCFILGNGPSLSKMDLSPLKNEITFGLNRIYLLSNRISFRPTYYVCVNELVLEQFYSEIKIISAFKFLNWNRRKLFNFSDRSVSFVRISNAIDDGFNKSFAAPFYSGGTVTYVAMQIAFMMGFSEVILLGIDHSFAVNGTPNKVETRSSAVDVNHFHPDYFPKGSKWQLPDLVRSEIAYSHARRVYEESGRRILDATVDGHCPSFEKVDFTQQFASK